MITTPPGVRVLVATRPVDFRKGMDGLAALAQQSPAQDPFCGTVLMLRAKRADRVKILFWDGNGLVLVNFDGPLKGLSRVRVLSGPPRTLPLPGRQSSLRKMRGNFDIWGRLLAQEFPRRQLF